MGLAGNFWRWVEGCIRPLEHIDMNGKEIKGLPTMGFPIADDEVATKKYVDDNLGESDHGQLTGLGDDDHGQYLNTSRHDTTTRHPYSVIKTSNGSASGTCLVDNFKTITMHDRSFFPKIYAASRLTVETQDGGADPGNYVGRFIIYNKWASNKAYNIKWRYLSASGKTLKIWVIVNEVGEIQDCWEALDLPDPKHPNEAPISSGSHPSRWKTLRVTSPIPYKDLETISNLEAVSISEYILKNYKVDLKKKKLKKLGE